MFFKHSKGDRIFVLLFLIVLNVSLPSAFAQSTSKAPPTQAVNSQWMVVLFSGGANAINEKVKEASVRARNVRSGLADTTGQLEALKLKISMLKTALAINTIPSPVVDKLLLTYSADEAQLSSNADSLNSEIEELKKGRAKEAASEIAVKTQIEILKNSPVWSEQIESAYEQYEAAKIGLPAATRELQDVLSKQLSLVKQQKDLIDWVLPRLKTLQHAYMAGLINCNRRPPFWRQLGDLWTSVGVLPGSAWRWYIGLVRSGRIQAFLQKRPALFAGLLFLIAILVWGARHVKSGIESFMERIRPDGGYIGVHLLISLSGSLVALMRPIAFMVWLTVVYAVLGLFDAVPALVLLYSLAGLLVLSILIRMVRDLFSVTQAGSRSFRLHLELYLAYVVLGFVVTAFLCMNNFRTPYL